MECSCRAWLSVRHSVGLGHLRHVGSVFAGREYSRGYFCAPLVQHEMGEQEFYKIVLREERLFFFMGSKRGCTGKDRETERGYSKSSLRKYFLKKN